jgi:hypothetical protein
MKTSFLKNSSWLITFICEQGFVGFFCQDMGGGGSKEVNLLFSHGNNVPGAAAIKKQAYLLCRT